MFITKIKKFHLLNYSQTWQQSLKDKAIVKNNYHTNGDIKKAKAFVSMVSNYSFFPVNETQPEQIIFSSNTKIAPAYSC